VLVAVIAVVISLVSAPGYAAQQSGRDTVEELRQQAVKARTDLEKATKQLDSRRQALVRSQTALKTTLVDLGVADTDLDRIREPLARLANAAYQGGAINSSRCRRRSHLPCGRAERFGQAGRRPE
jgi:hypothetical protein